MKPQLTRRDLFWLVVVAGMASGWWLERSHLNSRMQDLGDRVRDLEETSIQRQWAGVWMPPPGTVVRDGFQVDVF